MAVKLERTVTCLEHLLPIKPHDHISHGFARSRGKIKTYSTMLMATKPGRLRIYNKKLSSIRSQGLFVSPSNTLYFITTMTTETKLGMVVIYNEELPYKKSEDPLIIPSYKVTWQFKNVNSLVS